MVKLDREVEEKVVTIVLVAVVADSESHRPTDVPVD